MHGCADHLGQTLKGYGLLKHKFHLVHSWVLCPIYSSKRFAELDKMIRKNDFTNNKFLGYHDVMSFDDFCKIR